MRVEGHGKGREEVGWERVYEYPLRSVTRIVTFITGVCDVVLTIYIPLIVE